MSIENKQSAKKPLTGSPLQPSDQALFGLGKKMVEESVQIGRDFAKTMIQFSFAAIPVYIAILKQYSAEPKNTLEAIIQVAPNVFFLMSAMCFIVSFLPKKAEIVVNIVELMEEGLGKAAHRRSRLNYLGTVFFILGVLGGSAALMFVFY
ncbi:hypothetical protein [Desulfosarcina ovata]|nr:hypothetical protein [Desulfosarcina ovata]